MDVEYKDGTPPESALQQQVLSYILHKKYKVYWVYKYCIFQYECRGTVSLKFECKSTTLYTVCNATVITYLQKF